MRTNYPVAFYRALLLENNYSALQICAKVFLKETHCKTIEYLAGEREELIQEAENLEARIRIGRGQTVENLKERTRQTRHQINQYTVGLALLSKR